MREFFKILFFVILIVLLGACDERIDLNDTIVDVPKNGYIFFNTERATRAELEKDKLLKSFNVIGYKYSSSVQGGWTTVKVQAKQNGDMGVFASIPQMVVYNSDKKTHSYSNPKEWLPNTRYAFFAWYPTGSESTDLTIDFNNATKDANDNPISSENVEGEPYITYTLPIGTDRDARKKMYDVMTACNLNYFKEMGVSVPLEMEHRLAALDIRGMSMINATALNEAWWKESPKFDVNDEISVKVTSLSLSLDPIKASVKIPLNTVIDPYDEDIADQQMVADGSLSKEYTGFAGGTMKYYNAEDDIVDLAAADEKLILIPQHEPITATVEVWYEIYCNGKEITEDKLPKDDDGKPQAQFYGEKTVTIDELNEGVYHYLLITFTKAGIFVKVAAEKTWAETDIYYEFN